MMVREPHDKENDTSTENICIHNTGNNIFLDTIWTFYYLFIVN